VPIASLSRFVLKHKTWVASFWLAIVVIAIFAMPWSLDNLSQSFDIPDTESSDMAMEAARVYGNDGSSSPLVLVSTLPEDATLDPANVRDEWLAVEESVVAAEPLARVLSYGSTGDPVFISEDQRTSFALVFLPRFGEGMVGQESVTAAVADDTVAGEPVLVTGRPAIESDGGGEEGGDTGVLIETLVGGLGALLVLLYVFGSALALMPLIVAAVSILTSFLLIGVLASFTDINFIVQFLVALIGLGVAVDYSLLIVKRWREERDAGIPNEAAVQRAMETAGHAVIFSGTTVGVGLVALIAVPIAFFRGMGVGGMVIPLISVVVSITLLPVILAVAGPAMDRIALRRTKKQDDHRGWFRWGSFVVRNRWMAVAVGLVLLGVLIIPATQLSLGAPRPDSLNSSGNAEIALLALEESGIDGGVFDPLVIFVNGDPEPVVNAVSEIEGVRGVVAPDSEQFRRDGTSLVTVIPQRGGDNADGRALVDRVRSALDETDGDPLVGGGPASGADFIEKVYGSFPLMILLVAIVTYVLLVRAFRSLLLPLKALILNVLSVAAAYGVLVVVWQWGWGSDLIWGIPSTGSITEWVPIMIFAFLFGLSMDYEVFIMHRMREEYDEGHDTDTAVVRGLAFTGKLVTCAALILFLAFVAMASTPQTEIKIMATGLAAGILIDAVVIRTFLVPALTSLMGKWNWWLPGWLTWIAPNPQQLTRVDGVESEPSLLA
jgi:RND superfamily putative drug exporter